MERKRVVMWTENKLIRFKAVCAEHVKAGDTMFVFDGYEFLTSYAKYVIEYLNTKFPSPTTKDKS